VKKSPSFEKVVQFGSAMAGPPKGRSVGRAGVEGLHSDFGDWQCLKGGEPPDHVGELHLCRTTRTRPS
jgi:hypothetical protein